LNTTDVPRPRGLEIESARPVVMMVEDDEDHREIYGSLLWYNGFNVLLVPDAGSARRTLGFLRPDLILLDIGLPDGNGLEILGGLRETHQRLVIPVVALSAFPSVEMEARALGAGCLRYLEKQVSGPLAVLRAVEDVLGRAPPSGEGATSWLLNYPTQPPRRG
jgi:DNA-binding response OmpR family regulator